MADEQMVTLVIPENLSSLYQTPNAAPTDTDSASLQAHILQLQQVVALQEAAIILQNAGMKVEILSVLEEEAYLDDDDLS